MSSQTMPTLDPRDAESIAQELLSRVPAFVPGWQLREGNAPWALLHVTARTVQAVIKRLNQAPDKNLLAFLDMLGISLIPAQAARAPVVFQVPTDSQDPRLSVSLRRLRQHYRLGGAQPAYSRSGAPAVPGRPGCVPGGNHRALAGNHDRDRHFCLRLAADVG